MTHEEKLKLLQDITANGAQIDQINFGDGYQNCTFVNNKPKAELSAVAEDVACEEVDEQAGEDEDSPAGVARSFSQDEIDMLCINKNAESIMQLIQRYKRGFTNATDWLIPYCALRQRCNIPDNAKAYVTAVNEIYNANVCYDNFAKQLKKYGQIIYDWDTSDKRVDKRQRMALEFLEDLRKIK